MNYALNFQNAVALGLKWGVGRTISGAEVLAFRGALRDVGTEGRDECALLAWLTGAQPEAELRWWEVHRTSIEDQCEAAGYTHTDLPGAVARLSEASPMLANLLYVKATAKVEAEQASAERNAKQSFAKSKDELLDLLDGANDAVKLAVTDPLTFLKTVGDITQEAAGGLLNLIPGGGWTVAGAALVFVIGGYIVWQLK